MSTKNLKIIVSFVLSVLLFVGCIVLGYGAGTSWTFKKADINQEENTAESSIRLMSMKISTDEYAEYGVSALTESASVITATIIPANTTNKNLIWSCDDTSGMVTVTAVENNPLQAVVAVAGVFETQVTITCMLEVNTSIKATLTVDYVRTLSAQNYEYDILDIVEEAWCLQDVTYVQGTINPTSISGEYYFAMDLDLYNYLNPLHNSVVRSISVEDGLYRNFYLKDLFGTTDETEVEEIFGDIARYYYGQEWIKIAYLSYADVHCYYNGVEMSFIEDTVIEMDCILENTNSITVEPTDVSLSDDSLIFGAIG